MQIKKTNDIVTGNVSLLIYGRAGIGKTRWCATADNPLFLDCERGLLSLQDNDISYINIKSIDHLRSMFGDLIKHLNKHNHTLIVDSITELSDMAMQQIKADLGQGAGKDARKTYPELYDKTIALIRAIQALPCDIVFTAKCDRTDNGVHFPRMQGSRLKSELTHYFDTLAYLDGNEQDGIIAITGVREHCEAKDRSGKLEQIIDVDNTSLATVINQMKGLPTDGQAAQPLRPPTGDRRTKEETPKPKG